MQVQVVLPDVGLEPDVEMVVSFWFAEKGEEVLEGDRLVEILAGSITFDLPVPINGRLFEVLREEEEAVHTGDVLAVLETDVDDMSECANE